MDLFTPHLLVDAQKCSVNIDMMAKKASAHGLMFRPHFKTHQNLEVAEIFRKKGVGSITVSSVEMAGFFAGAGWNDITIAFPVNILEIQKINTLANLISLNVLGESVETVQFLNNNLTAKTGLFIKIDAGYNRTGIKADDLTAIERVVEAARTSKKLELKGFLIHSGHTYQAGSKEKILEIHHQSLITAKKLKDAFAGMIVSIGDTPGCSLADDFTNVDEIRPGNFVYYDMMQYYLGSCVFEQIAALVACPVVAVHHEKSEIVVYGGAVHLSKEMILVNNEKYYGACALLNEKLKWHSLCQDSWVESFSQEHGVIRAGKDLLDWAKPGSVIGILPVHSCLSANLLKEKTIFV